MTIEKELFEIISKKFKKKNLKVIHEILNQSMYSIVVCDIDNKSIQNVIDEKKYELYVTVNIPNEISRVQTIRAKTENENISFHFIKEFKEWIGEL